MSYFEKQLREIYRSEVTGEAMFSVLARLALGADKRQKWDCLRQLESQTKQGFLEYIKKNDIDCRFPVRAYFGGYFFGLIFCLLPWRTAMRALHSGTGSLIDTFQGLQDSAVVTDKAYFSSIVAEKLG